VKILFVGEGANDIGAPTNIPGFVRPAGGTVCALARRASDVVGTDSIAMEWREVPRFSRNPSAKRSGYSGKIAAAALLAKIQYNCAGTVVVADRDRDADRNLDLQDGVERAAKSVKDHVTIWGLAIKSIEAWTLGAPAAIAGVLEVDVERVREHYPRGVDVESLSESSGKPEYRPKQLLARIAQLKHQVDCTEFREAVAERTDVDELARQCPQGFAPFLQRLRSLLEPIKPD
jgi:hypothetical protein